MFTLISFDADLSTVRCPDFQVQKIQETLQTI